jgi:hypothetical protein
MSLVDGDVVTVKVGDKTFDYHFHTGDTADSVADAIKADINSAVTSSQLSDITATASGSVLTVSSDVLGATWSVQAFERPDPVATFDYDGVSPQLTAVGDVEIDKAQGAGDKHEIAKVYDSKDLTALTVTVTDDLGAEHTHTVNVSALPGKMTGTVVWGSGGVYDLSDDTYLGPLSLTPDDVESVRLVATYGEGGSAVTTVAVFDDGQGHVSNVLGQWVGRVDPTPGSNSNDTFTLEDGVIRQVVKVSESVGTTFTADDVLTSGVTVSAKTVTPIDETTHPEFFADVGLYQPAQDASLSLTNATLSTSKVFEVTATLTGGSVTGVLSLPYMANSVTEAQLQSAVRFAIDAANGYSATDAQLDEAATVHEFTLSAIDSYVGTSLGSVVIDFAGDPKIDQPSGAFSSLTDANDYNAAVAADATGMGSYTYYEVAVTPSTGQEGTLTAYIEADGIEDLAGNPVSSDLTPLFQNYYSGEITVDTVAPVATSIAVTSVGDGAIAGGETVVFGVGPPKTGGT